MHTTKIKNLTSCRRCSVQRKIKQSFAAKCQKTNVAQFFKNVVNILTELTTQGYRFLAFTLRKTFFNLSKNIKLEMSDQIRHQNYSQEAEQNTQQHK